MKQTRKHILSLALTLLAATAMQAVRISPLYRERLLAAGDTATLHRALRSEQAMRHFVPDDATQRPRRAAQATEALSLNLAPHGLVILVQFSDVQFQPGNTQAAFDSLFNSDSYQYGGAFGSVAQYFHDQSNGQYHPHFDVFGPVTLSNTQSYYGQNNSYGGDSYDRLSAFVKEACQLANSNFSHLDYANYDNDGDGLVDFVYFIYAGRGEADGGGDNTIWPHNSYYNRVLTLDGKRIQNYACSNELAEKVVRQTITSYETEIARNGVGTPCHEFSHVCGLPDLYKTDGETGSVLGAWDILDAGSYAGNYIGNRPVGYSAYEKFFCGWIQPTTLNEACSISLQPLSKDGNAYIINGFGTHISSGLNPSPTTFYILENRQRTDWDNSLPGKGLMIMKIQFNENKWRSNSVNNNANNLGVSLVMASDKTISDSYTGGANDLFPSGLNKSFTPYANYPITNITSNIFHGTIDFDFMGGGQLLNALEETDTNLPSSGLFLHNGRIIIRHGNTYYNLQGQRL